eukprot:GHVU01225910.1.p1 GENE.GHVU01225910.1~~GHVU01225910.1.p1  ORF type:complete len:202 (-),score=24.57 GHVU01225910.1:386-991(-)
MLDGYGCVSAMDIKDSREFLDRIGKFTSAKGGPCNFGRAIDCGAGIGRVSKGLLCPRFQVVDMLEPVAKHIEKAKEELKETNVDRFFNVPLEGWTPDAGLKYDCFWVQWCALYVTDDDLKSFLKKAASALNEQGVICVKENVVMDGGFQCDVQDNSLMRTHAHYLRLFDEAGMKVLMMKRQTGFPPGLFPVYMYCMRPQRV